MLLNLEATVALYPSAKDVHADMALFEVVHTVEKVISVKLKLFSKISELNVRTGGSSQ